ncbi:MAG: extracellular solute-binding protein [Lachnospiraceae bacterium]|jgi:raffinose/stachyose/melibiose transport system substrate-binding protein|nr:extracellular solute-binding protein [Lachnospiraceae bacterium]
MRKALALGLVGALAATSLVGCGSNESNTSDKGDSKKGVTIKVVTTYAGEDSNAQNYKDAVAAWEKKTGNKVDDQSATADEAFKTRVITDFQTGSEPDVLFYFNGVDSNDFVQQGKVVSIDDIRAKYSDYASNMKEDLLTASPADGVKYSVPVNGYWEGLFVNKEVLEKAGVEVPTSSTTWEEFLTMCQTIKDAGFTPIAASLAEVPHYWFEYSIFNHRSVATHNALPGAADDEQGKAWAAGLDDITTLYEKGFFPENTLTAKDEETFQYFVQDKAAFLIDGSWKIGGIQEAVDDIDNYTVTYVPGMADRKTTDIIGGISSGYFITKKGWDDAAKQAAIVDFVEYMTSDEVVSKFAGTSVTALKNGCSVDASSLTGLENDAIKFCAGTSGIAGAVEDNLTPDERTPIFGEMAKIVKKEKTSSDAVKEVLDIVADR